MTPFGSLAKKLPVIKSSCPALLLGHKTVGFLSCNGVSKHTRFFIHVLATRQNVRIATWGVFSQAYKDPQIPYRYGKKWMKLFQSCTVFYISIFFIQFKTRVSHWVWNYRLLGITDTRLEQWVYMNRIQKHAISTYQVSIWS